MKVGFLGFTLAAAIAFGRIAHGNVDHPIPYTQVSEVNAESFATVGKNEREILKKFGPPNMTDTSRGIEIWTYLTDPKLTVKATLLSYAGFEVFFKDKKATYLGVIRRS